MSEDQTREQIYDEQIAPLVAQFIEICQKHDIPVLASFQLAVETEIEGPLVCTTALLPEWACENLHDAADIIYGDDDYAVRMIITMKDVQ